MKGAWTVALSVAAGALLPALAAAAEYHARVDVRAQAVAFRGVALDSIPVAEVVVRPDGSTWTPDGFAVRCDPGDTHCTFFRPGPRRSGAPVATTARVAVWDPAHPGLSIRASGRAGFDAGRGDWPQSDRSFELLEGRLEWTSRPLEVRLGRLREFSRLGVAGYDGGRVEGRAGGARAAAYGGWGLARSSALPVTDPANDPLEEFLPQRRQWLVGADARWSARRVELRALFQREVDPRADDLVSDRAGADAGVRLPGGVRLSGGADYDLAAKWWGSAEVGARVLRDGVLRSVAVEARRVRPHFPLWTIWGAFSPVPLRAVSARAELAPLPGVTVHARGELFAYDDTEAVTPLVKTEDDGWRWSAGAAWNVGDWTASGALHREFGPGAASLGGAGAVHWRLTPAWSAGVSARFLRRPLELRFDEAEVLTLGASVGYERAGHRIALDVRHVHEERDRPDAAAFDWNQLRAGLSASFAFGSAPQLPPAVLRMPREVSP